MADYWTTVLADSPVALWKMNETSGTNLADASGNGHNGTLNGTFSLNQTGLIVSDPLDGCISFGTGVGNNFTFTNIVEAGGSTFSVECTVKCPSAAQNCALLDDTGNHAGFYLHNSGSNDFLASWLDNGGVYHSGAVHLALGSTHHLVMTNAGSGGSRAVKFYIDGVLDDPSYTFSNPNGPTWSMAANDTVANMYLGTGSLQGLSVFSTTLTQGQVTTHYTAWATPSSSNAPTPRTNPTARTSPRNRTAPTTRQGGTAR